MVLTTMGVRAQITIGGNVYGGGNEGEVKGNATVTVHAGTLNSVYGGARVANVGGRTFVNVDGEHATGDILAKAVYGGNDISGTIGQNAKKETTVPDSLKNVARTEADKTNFKKNAIDNTWKTFVRTGVSDSAVVIGSLYGGGNGDYEYPAPTPKDGKYYHNVYHTPRTSGDTPVITKITDTEDRVFNVPDLSKTYLEITGGCIAHTYGGGNNATVTEATVINIDNASDHLMKQAAAFAAHHGITDQSIVYNYLKDMVGLTTFQSDLTSFAFNHARIYGGNNKATMSIMPTWNLQRGIIRDLYSGGNQGDMTNSFGLLLDIDPVKPDSLIINNVYGGCRRADVRPLQPNGMASTSDQIQLPFGLASNDGEPYLFPAGMPARLVIRGGQITNVYGGNDISGRVFGGNAIGIRTSILGDVYGGGNGSYAYTDNAELGKMDEYKDFYYDTLEVKRKEISYGNEGFHYTSERLESVEALNIFRPNAEQVSIRLWGKSAEKPTIIGGRVFVGGNSATLKPNATDTIVELKVGSHVMADKVFLGNNGENMITYDAVNPEKGVLSIYKNEYEGKKYTSMHLDTASTEFATYMEGCVMTMKPKVVFDNKSIGDPDNYQDYSSYFGSFYCGGNVGSMRFKGSDTINVNKKVVIFEKFVGGCNNADIAASDFNTAYYGGVLGEPDEDGDKIILNISEMRLQPLRWKVEREATNYAVKKTDGKGNYLYELDNNGNRQLEWNVISATTRKEITPTPSNNNNYLDRRLYGANVYGGCCESGHVAGNVVINLQGTIVDREGTHGVFATATPNDGDADILYGHESYTIPSTDSPNYRSGVILNEQGMDVLGSALTVFGGGKGAGTEIWGKSTVNITGGYSFQAFGGSESGVIGKSREASGEEIQDDDYVFNDRHYPADPTYSTYVNLNDPDDVVPRGHEDSTDDMADLEFIYGGGFEGPIMGNTYVHLDNGRLFNLFAGSCNADILGHTETYIGQTGFPYMRDHIYGGNDLGGEIKGEVDLSSHVVDYDSRKSMIHGYAENTVPDVLKASTYVEYIKGSTKSIFGGSFGDYDYVKEFKSPDYSIPTFNNSFVNIKPVANEKNSIERVFGAGEGAPGVRVGDKMQNRSYVLIDIPDGMTQFRKTEVFGSGSNNGLGMSFEPSTTFGSNFNLDRASAIIDLMRGQIGNVFGGSHNEGVTRRTVVNVPAGSTIWMYSEEPDNEEDPDGTKTKYEKKYGNIFGGAYGTQILPPCDVYESNVNYHSDQAVVNGSIFGGNNNVRRTLFTHVNIDVPVWSNELKAQKGYLGTVYGAGQGVNTWSEHTEVNLLNGAQVYEVYGGGMMGHVLNVNSVQQYMQNFKNGPSAEILADDQTWSSPERWDSEGNMKPKYVEDWAKDWTDAWTLGEYYTPNSPYYNNYVNNNNTNLDRLRPRQELDDKTGSQLAATKFNTNVIINEGAYVANYAYGGGYGKKKKPQSGDVYGTTYIALLGGKVNKDIYAAGTAGGVSDLFKVRQSSTSNPYGFTASANVYIKGGTCRNVYGGGWEGSVGIGDNANPLANDVLAETYVVIGNQTGNTFTNGIPAIQRNVYGGGEGGAVYGTAHLTLNNGYVGYQFDPSMEDDQGTTGFNEQYIEKIEDETYKDKNNQFIPNSNLLKSGCLFGGGYIDNSSVDKTEVSIYSGQVRNSAFGGGEIAAIGRGTVSKSSSGKSIALYRPGKTTIEMFGGHVHHNVFGGGRGYDNLGRHGSLNADGYVFGQTEVHIHGGEIGTKEELSDSVGNVFGGGDLGFVYSAYEIEEEQNGVMVVTGFGKGVKAGNRYNKDVDPSDEDNYNYQGYYYQHDWADSGSFVTETVNGNEERLFTEDCKVVVEPHAKALADIYINDEYYGEGSYVPTAALNLLGKKDGDARWENLSDEGIIIHNAVFAGGNTSSTSASSSVAGVNTPSVFGNATASIHDVYHRDLITLGTRHTGGLYGDGNLTLVDGYRELNITNYGTDYYSIAKEIDNTSYHALPEREQAYYELRYTCQQECKDKDGTLYKKETTDEQGFTTKASTLTADELQNLFLNYNEENVPTSSVQYNSVDVMVYDNTNKEWKPNETFWKESGVLPVYAGRLMNSIQRADFCGVWGSRMVMQGARDRVPKEPDYTHYTINRVREVSLNKKVSARQGDEYYDDSGDEGNDLMHGNYFGIYNIVNYLGALTSDVKFDDTRVTTATDSQYQPASQGQTYYDWKEAHRNDRTRNNGNSHNKVALASGVYLELTTEEGEERGTGLYEKEWGPITGVVELDLINVSTGIGGGFVYAKNIHGVRTPSGRKNTTLTALNDNAATKWDYIYNPPEHLNGSSLNSEDAKKEFETSGNFVHSTQTIIDDCYNTSNRYKGEVRPDGTGAMPAHYWYIKGSVYVYPQLISAYTGTANAFSEKVEIPLTISAASHGSMKLLNVMPNRYAYFSSPGVPLQEGKKVIINDKEYYKNDPISYWDWYLLSNSEKKLFVEDTYVNCVACNIDGVAYAAGAYIMNEDDYSKFAAKTHTYTDANGRPVKDSDNETASTDYIFRPSNNISHDTGYILTYNVDNPTVWDNWYTPKEESYRNKIDTEDYNKLNSEGKKAYDDGPTYRLKGEDNAVLGQREYKRGAIISEDIQTNYPYTTDNKPDGQANFEPAFIVTKMETVNVKVGSETVERRLNPGVAVPDSIANLIPGSVDEAYVCTRTVKIGDTEFIYKDSKMTEAEYNTLLAANPTLEDQIKKSILPAYYCTKDGLYGGRRYISGQNYRGLEAWSAMSEEDRSQFEFNYDALDLLIDPTYGNKEGEKYQYDGNYDSEEAVRSTTTGNKAGYSVTQSVDYTASYTGSDDLNVGKEIVVQRFNTTTNQFEPVTRSDGYVKNGDELSREDFEALPNEKRHYAPIVVTEAGTYYVVNTAFQIGSTPYAIGNTISSSTYIGLPDSEKDNVTTIEFGTEDKGKKYYYCREAYKISENGHAVKDVKDNTTYAIGDSVELGTIISADNNTVGANTYYGYDNLTNNQKDFTIHGTSPTETTTLFVSRESDIHDLMQDKIITVIYQYDYEESDASGNITPVSERHVLNITIKFKNGVPIVEDIMEPDIILPGGFLTDDGHLVEPHVTYDAGELLGGGWELYRTESDAESHSNPIRFDGNDFNPSDNPLYWYQNDWWVAYFVRSIEAGHTYSNHVPVHVANYHDLKKVTDAKTHHYYIDEPEVYRDPKIYINDYSTSSENGLDLFKKLYDLSVQDNPTLANDTITTGDLKGHKPLGTQVRAGRNLEFFLRTDIDHTGSAWTPIGSNNVSDNPTTTDVDEATSGTPKGDCFDGVLHGDGHTISGLDHSLFAHLCGEVYNLGVTGSFTGSGVADEGDGYVESSWVKTSATITEGTKAVFGGATNVSHEQLVNSYFPESNSGYTADKAIMKPDRAFYNGEVAYDLNNFYLYKRYNDNAMPGGTATYKYWKPGEAEPVTATYASNPDLCSSGYNKLKYVENRFADGDFVYANGVIPEEEDERYFLETTTENGVTKSEPHYYPIWPDDYLFFGQALNYNHVENRYHQNTPSSILRSGGRVVTTINGNRVYRAPAYFRSSVLSSAYYNPYAVFAQSNAKNDTVAYRNMTAIDFTGYHERNESYEAGLVTSGGLPARFYPPLLDDDGLADFVNKDLTKNLLVYTEEDGQTATVVGNYLSKEPTYAESHEKYRTVAKQQTGDIHGHWVANRIAPLDHFLVDKQDFNVPIRYDFAEGKRMWYQRTPDRYIDIAWSNDATPVRSTTGWEDVSLPFKAELVTTNEKGEITHFYGESESSRNGTGTKLGHEYWLREFDGQNGTVTDGIYTANFNYPAANSTDGPKDYSNTFLWDYYYSHNSYYDQNSDKYQEDDANRYYYKKGHTYENYPRLAAGTPYIIGFPGERYYEFDLSGKFEASTAKAEQPAKINDPQVITFASKPGITINVSDDETGGVSNGDSYNFKPSYLNESFTAGTGTTPTYTLNGAGNSYDLVTGTETPVVTYAFRPYFLKTSGSRQTRSIIFSNNGLEQLSPDSHVVEPGILEIHAVGHNIVVTSSLKFTTDVRILNTAGLTMKTFAIRPGETIETRIFNAGVYIVQDEEGKYTKKLSVK